MQQGSCTFGRIGQLQQLAADSRHRIAHRISEGRRSGGFDVKTADRLPFLTTLCRTRLCCSSRQVSQPRSFRVGRFHPVSTLRCDIVPKLHRRAAATPRDPRWALTLRWSVRFQSTKNRCRDPWWRARPVWQREIGEPNRAPIILADCSALGPR